ncbi:MAG: hypothetical protein LBN30_08965 [Oscillospiraceae bacterium]|jgi:hypothetical protein|nr:hypothetical protein [Oscillospiraceae bacterium]
MLALIDFAHVARPALRRRLFPKPPRIREERVLGMSALRATVTAWDAASCQSACARLAQTLNNAAVRTAVFADGFAYRAAFPELQDAPTDLLHDAFLPEIAERLATYGASCALFVDRVTDTAVRTLHAMCHAYRYVAAEIPNSAELIRELERDYGVSFATMRSPDVALALGGGQRGITAKRIAAAATLTQRNQLRAPRIVRDLDVAVTKPNCVFPTGFQPNPIIAAALDCYALNKRDLTLRNIIT